MILKRRRADGLRGAAFVFCAAYSLIIFQRIRRVAYRLRERDWQMQGGGIKAWFTKAGFDKSGKKFYNKKTDFIGKVYKGIFY